MFEIYKRARRVLVWLGCAKPSTMRTIARLKPIGMALREKETLLPHCDAMWRGYSVGDVRDGDHLGNISRFTLVA